MTEDLDCPFRCEREADCSLVAMLLLSSCTRRLWLHWASKEDPPGKFAGVAIQPLQIGNPLWLFGELVRTRSS